MHSRAALLVASLVFTGPALGDDNRAVRDRVSESIVKVRVVNETRRLATGSAVALGKGMLVTSCHGTRNARVIDILARGQQRQVRQQVKDIEHDLCLLEVAEGAFAALELASEADDLKVGDYVAAIGFAGVQLQFSEGTVKALHRYDRSNVIQTDARFAKGESGGALVNRAGKLVGILTFFAHGRSDFYFAVPVGWVQTLLDRAQTNAPAASQPERSFWERADRERPPFLQAAAREYEQDWAGLRDVASQWVEQDADNAQAWLALGKAHHHSRREGAAIEALHEAVKLDPQHPAGWYYLGAAYRELNETQGVQESLQRLDALDPKAARALRDGSPME